MIKRKGKALISLTLCMVMFCTSPLCSRAETVNSMESVGIKVSSFLSVRIDRPKVEIYSSASDQSQSVGYAVQGKSYDVLNSVKGGWVRIQSDETYGYIRVAGNATLIERTREKMDANQDLRQKVVSFALQFVGNPYVYGGTDPYKGIDCSAFTRYVMETAAGVRLARTTVEQSRQGLVVDLTQVRPGDLIFYGEGDIINHVAIYIGSGQVVHASTEETGIITSYWLYRDPVKVCRMIED